MKLTFAALAAAAAIAAAADPEATAKCQRTELGPVVLTKPDAKLPRDGGILVGWENSTTAEQTKGDPSVQPTWTAIANGKPIALALTTLAPGLTLYTPAKPAVGKLALADAKHTVLATVIVGGSPADAKTALDAPKVTHAFLKTFNEGRMHDQTSLTAAVESVPDAAVALVVYSHIGPAHAASFGRVPHDKQGATTVLVAASAGHCGRNPPDTEAALVGGKITFAWVDAAGHVSPQSALLAVEADPAAKPSE